MAAQLLRVSQPVMTPERLAEIEWRRLRLLDPRCTDTYWPIDFARELLTALREATEAVMALERPIQAALINERDALQRRVEALEKINVRTLAKVIYEAEEQERSKEEDAFGVWTPWEEQTSRREQRVYLACATAVLAALRGETG